MDASIGIIGGADGPTAIFVSTGQPEWFSTFGLVIVVLMLIPNCIYAFRHKQKLVAGQSSLLTLLEQIGRYGCMIFMVINPMPVQPSLAGYLAYIIGSIILLAAYWLVWLLYFRRDVRWKRMALAILPSLLFLLCGAATQHWLLLACAVLFSISHISSTYKNA